MKKTLISFALVVLLVALSAVGARADTPPPPPIGSASGILIDMRNAKILWAKDDEVARAPASLTKILTALIVLERTKLKSKVTISPEARGAEGARIFAEAGWTFSVQDLLWGMLLQSGNDAAVALAQQASPDGTVEGFVKLMNDRAAAIGATASSFRNPHGLDEVGHTATARDLARIASVAMRNEVFAGMVSTRTHSLLWGDGSTREWINTNKMLWRYQDTIGIKTAYTTEAGRGLASAVKRGKTTLLAIVLDAHDQYADSAALYDWAFANLPALEANAISLKAQKKPIPQPNEAAAPTNQAGAGRLKVVDYRGSEPASNEPAPLVVPLVTLGAVTLVAYRIRKLMGRRNERIRRPIPRPPQSRVPRVREREPTPAGQAR